MDAIRVGVAAVMSIACAVEGGAIVFAVLKLALGPDIGFAVGPLGLLSAAISAGAALACGVAVWQFRDDVLRVHTAQSARPWTRTEGYRFGFLLMIVALAIGCVVCNIVFAGAPSGRFTLFDGISGPLTDGMGFLSAHEAYWPAVFLIVVGASSAMIWEFAMPPTTPE